MNAKSALISLPFADREDAAHQLANALGKYTGSRPIVLAIPRGGVPIGRIIADTLGGELDVALVRKLGAPGHAEFAIGSIDEQGNVMLGEHIEWAGADAAYIHRDAECQLQVIRKRRALYHLEFHSGSLEGRTVIVVDDGLATGATMMAAL